MKKRSRKAASLYKEPSSDLSDLDLSSEDESQKFGAAASTQDKSTQKRSKPRVSKTASRVE